MLENLEFLHAFEDRGSVGQYLLIGRMHIHRYGKMPEQFIHAPDMVKMAMGEENGIRGEVVASQKIQKVLNALVRGHAGVHYRTGLLAIGPKHHAIGSQRVKSKYAGLKHR